MVKESYLYHVQVVVVISLVRYCELVKVCENKNCEYAVNLLCLIEDAYHSASVNSTLRVRCRGQSIAE